MRPFFLFVVSPSSKIFCQGVPVNSQDFALKDFKEIVIPDNFSSFHVAKNICSEGRFCFVKNNGSFDCVSKLDLK
jgi:hypothetical protein